MQTVFEGTWIPVITPFQGDAIDHPALAKLSRHLAAQGISGFIAGATTGEGACTEAASKQARHLASLRPDGLLVTAPVYVRPSQAGIERHIEVILDAADLPVLIYNIPYRTGVNIEIDTLQRLARDRRVAGIKECGGNNDRMLRLVHETPLKVLSGDDNQNFAALCLGAHGTIAASAHIQTHWHIRMRELILQGKLTEARRIAVALQAIISSLFSEPNPAPLKALMAQQGWCSDRVRLPFLPASFPLQEQLKKQWNDLQTLTLS